MHKGTTLLSRGVSFIAAGWLLALGGALRADEPVSWRYDYREAYHESSRLEKPMLVQISAQNCRQSAAMAGRTYRDGRVSRQVSVRFVPVALNARDHAELVEQFGVSELPATIIVSPEKRIVKRLAGYHAAHDFERELVDVCTGSEPDRLHPIPALPGRRSPPLPGAIADASR